MAASPTRPLLQPEATGAVMEVTKWLKPSAAHSDESGHRLRLPTVRKTPTTDIRGLIDEVRLAPENGELPIVLSGELAGILSLCDSKKKPASSYEERAKQVSLF